MAVRSVHFYGWIHETYPKGIGDCDRWGHHTAYEEWAQRYWPVVADRLPGQWTWWKFFRLVLDGCIEDRMLRHALKEREKIDKFDKHPRHSPYDAVQQQWLIDFYDNNMTVNVEQLAYTPHIEEVRVRLLDTFGEHFSYYSINVELNALRKRGRLRRKGKDVRRVGTPRVVS
jgi:hypothetical protein